MEGERVTTTGPAFGRDPFFVTKEGTLDELTLEEIKSRILARQEQDIEQAELEAATAYRFVKPLGVAAIHYIDQVKSSDGRFMLGFPEVDKLLRGSGRGELVLVTGRAHSGKTQVMLNAVNNNSHKNILMFTPDETAEAVLAKLVAIRNTIPGDILEERVKAGDEQALKLVRHTATHDFPNLVVIDESLSFQDMGLALAEAEDMWGDNCDAVIYDFVELMQGATTGFEGVAGVLTGFKNWAKVAHAPLFAMHQGKKSEFQRGQATGMDGMRYGGEDKAIQVIEVFRKRDDRTMPEYDRLGHQDTVTINVAKNKRPPMRRGMVDLYLDPETGHIRTLDPTDLVRAGGATRDPTVALRAREAS